jgi:RHS repeat-associated protein
VQAGAILPRYRFSSKEWDAGVSLYSFGFRHACPTLARWLSRDPLAPRKGMSREHNLYGLLLNDPANRWDALGLSVNNHCQIAADNHAATFTPPNATSQMKCRCQASGAHEYDDPLPDKEWDVPELISSTPTSITRCDGTTQVLCANVWGTRHHKAFGGYHVYCVYNIVCFCTDLQNPSARPVRTIYPQKTIGHEEGRQENSWLLPGTRTVYQPCD